LLWTFAVNSGLHQIPTLTLMASHCGPLTVVLCKKLPPDRPESAHVQHHASPTRSAYFPASQTRPRARYRRRRRRGEVGFETFRRGARPHTRGPSTTPGTHRTSVDSWSRVRQPTRRYAGAATHRRGDTPNRQYNERAIHQRATPQSGRSVEQWTRPRPRHLGPTFLPGISATRGGTASSYAWDVAPP
jgi:hypothetical protein